ncbi:MAG: hypothetical protein AAGB12_13815 [Pseudomonadota bacterium]
MKKLSFSVSSTMSELECPVNRFLTKKSDNEYFVAEEGKGLFLIRTENDEIVFNERLYDIHLADKLVNYVDYSFETVWIATHKGLLPYMFSKKWELPEEILFGTSANGLFLLNTQNGKFRFITEKDGLSSSEVMYATYDDEDRLWVSASKNINIISKNGDIKTLDTRNIDSKFNEIVQLNDKMVIATQSKGFYVFDKQSLKLTEKIGKNRGATTLRTSGLFLAKENLFYATKNEILRFNLLD